MATAPIRKTRRQMAECEAKVKAVIQQFHLDHKQYEDVSKLMLSAMKAGLQPSKNPKAMLKMIPSYVTHLPDGTERGSFLALDLGGTNFRVLLVKINDPIDGKPDIEMDSQIYKMPNDVITGPGEKLFDHIAHCMADFIARLEVDDEVLPVGFTFSFPCQQDSLDSASLLTWTKGFTAAGVEGKNVVTMLKEAVQRRGDFLCNVIAVVNDTVGTLMSCAYAYPDCEVGLIVGTGSNACYMEKAANIERIPTNDGEMCINMEWGAFGDDGMLDEYRNEYDDDVDINSLNMGKQLFEKMISGMYMGEIVRLVLCRLTEQKAIFNGKRSEALFKRGSFETSYVSQIESCTVYNPIKWHETEPDTVAHDDPTATQNILASLGIMEANRNDCEVVTRVCQAVSRRAAYLCAAGIAAIAIKIGENREHRGKTITVGVDGTVYKKHPAFGTLMSQKTKELCANAGVNVEFALSFDGSGKGAALITAVADRVAKTKKSKK